MNLSRRIPALVLLAAMLGALTLGLWAHVATQALVSDAARASAVTGLTTARAALSASGDLPSGAFLDDRGIPPSLREEAARGNQATYLDWDRGTVWAAERTYDGYLLSFTAPVDAQRRLLRDFDTRLAWGTGIVVGGAALLAWLVTRTISRRLRRGAVTAARIAAGEPDETMAAALGGRDELTEFGRTIDELSAAMRERLAHERRVTADIAHDLRTPVTALVTAAGLLPESRPASLVRRQVDRLRLLVEDLLEVARLDQAEQHLDLTMTTTAALADAARESAVGPVDVRVDRDADVLTDTRRVQRVLANLVGNALSHGGTGVSIIVDGLDVMVRDDGPGFSPEMLRTATTPFVTGRPERGGGHGLGLTIAAGQARAIGALLSLSNAPEGGARAVLTLPPEPPEGAETT